MKRERRTYIAIAFIVICLCISIPLILFTAPRWPGAFTFTESRYTDNPEEEAALITAESFNYSIFAFETARFITQNRLNGYRLENVTFNPFLNISHHHINYFANVTWYPTLNLSFTQTPSYETLGSPLTTTANGTRIFPFEDMINVWEWAIGYWNGTSHESIQNDGSLNFTDIYHVRMKLTVEGDSWYNEYQEILVDSMNRVMFAFWLIRVVAVY